MTGEMPFQLQVVSRPWAIVNEDWRVERLNAGNDGMIWRGDHYARAPRTNSLLTVGLQGCVVG